MIYNVCCGVKAVYTTKVSNTALAVLIVLALLHILNKNRILSKIKSNILWKNWEDKVECTPKSRPLIKQVLLK